MSDYLDKKGKKIKEGDRVRRRSGNKQLLKYNGI